MLEKQLWEGLPFSNSVSFNKFGPSVLTDDLFSKCYSEVTYVISLPSYYHMPYFISNTSRPFYYQNWDVLCTMNGTCGKTVNFIECSRLKPIRIIHSLGHKLWEDWFHKCCEFHLLWWLKRSGAMRIIQYSYRENDIGFEILVCCFFF